jgi:hypothetical protein
MPELLGAFHAFVQEHRRYGDLESGVEGERVWMTCGCGAGRIRCSPRAVSRRTATRP